MARDQPEKCRPGRIPPVRVARDATSEIGSEGIKVLVWMRSVNLLPDSVGTDNCKAALEVQPEVEVTEQRGAT